jgi:hypothetical protein
MIRPPLLSLVNGKAVRRYANLQPIEVSTWQLLAEEEAEPTNNHVERFARCWLPP